MRRHLRTVLIGDDYSRAYRGVAQDSFLAVRCADLPLFAFFRRREQFLLFPVDHHLGGVHRRLSLLLADFYRDRVGSQSID